MVFYIQPLWLPVDYFTRKLIGDIHFILPLSKLKARTTNYIQIVGVSLGLEMEKKVEELEMGLDAQKGFAQMYEDGNMNKRIWGQVVKLHPIIR